VLAEDVECASGGFGMCLQKVWNGLLEDVKLKCERRCDKDW
jgi:hypothetical protein